MAAMAPRVSDLKEKGKVAVVVPKPPRPAAPVVEFREESRPRATAAEVMALASGAASITGERERGVPVARGAAADALKAALLALLAGDAEVRDAVYHVVMDPLRATEKLPMKGGPEGGSDAERAGFVVDLIEAHIPRLVRQESLRRPSGRQG